MSRRPTRAPSSACSALPTIPARTWNFVTGIIGTFVLVFVILAFGKTPTEVGYAINPARDLGPRIMHAVLPIRDKGSSGWSYAWIPVVAPIIGGVLGGLVADAVGFV